MTGWIRCIRPKSPPLLTETPPETIDEEEESDSANTILAPKSAMSGMTKVGEVCKMKVVADHGDEVELEYVRSPETKSTKMSTDEEIDAMDQG